MRYIQVIDMPKWSVSDTDAMQLVENEEMIGTLIETNERIIAAIETYDTVCSILFWQECY